MLTPNLLGKPLETGVHYHIFGAGISGLFTAFFLKEKGISFTVYEKADRAGGLLNTVSTNEGIAEGAANGFIWCEEIAYICQKAGIELVSTTKAHKAKYFFSDGKLKKLPFPLSNLGGVLFRAFFKKPGTYTTLADFGYELAGKEITDNIINPAFKGIYGAGADKLGFEALFPKLDESFKSSNTFFEAFLKTRTKEKKEKTPKGSHSFKGGMKILSEGLSHYLKDNIVYGSTKVPAPSDSCIFCLPAYEASPFFRGTGIENLLNRIYYTPIISITFFTDIYEESFKSKGFGVLVPDKAGLNTMGILLNNYIFPFRSYNGKLNFCCIVDASRLKGDNEQDIVQNIYEESKLILNTDFSILNKTMFSYAKGIPLYSPELPALLREINAQLRAVSSNHRLFGNYTGAISLRGLAQAAKQFTEAI